MQVLFEIEKSPALVPVVLISLTLSTFVPTLVSVTVWGLLEVPTGWFPNARPLGATFTTVPVPDRVMVCGLSSALSVMTTLPCRKPLSLGAKATSMVHCAPGATVAHASSGNFEIAGAVDAGYGQRLRTSIGKNDPLLAAGLAYQHHPKSEIVYGELNSGSITLSVQGHTLEPTQAGVS